MARIVNEEEHAQKRNDILDSAIKLVYTQGYERMTIQDIQADLQISSGAFYHYFDSKQDLLEAMVERMGGAAAQALMPILHDTGLTAIQKFHRYFEASAQWKSAGKTLILGVLHMWYNDDNAVIRQKMTAASLKGTPLILEPIIRQGIEEKVFTTQYPEQVAVIIAGVALTLTDSMVGLTLSPKPDPSAFQKLELILEAYFDTIERILGAPAGSLKSFGAETFKEWFVELEPTSK
ncbi:MAG: TetR/AcrR family transcriptional regulator [Anaerolineaceae bacterium]|nr:TetR/AcrR family transcriptional regulator [Anaerolineaceae bacterium]